MDKLPTPTPGEQDILKVLWEHGPSSVRAVHKLLDRSDDLAYNTVQTLLRIMEKKGLVGHHALGRTFIYTPNFSRADHASRFLDRVFDGAAAELVLSLLRAERISVQEMDQMQALIAQARAERKGKKGT